MKITKLTRYYPLGGTEEIQAYRLFNAKTYYDKCPKYPEVTRQRKDTEKQSVKTAYLALSDTDRQCRDCIKKLKELNYNFDYGLARDAMDYLLSKGLFYV